MCPVSRTQILDIHHVPVLTEYQHEINALHAVAVGQRASASGFTVIQPDKVL